MIIDNVLINALCRELSEKITLGKIDKILQIDPFIFVFKIRKSTENYDLLLSMHSENYRIQLSKLGDQTNKIVTPFLLILKKHLEGGAIKKIEQINLDRIIKITLECYDNLREKVEYQLIIELTGKYSNSLLTDKNELIIGAYRYVDEQRNEERQLLCASKYAPITNKFQKKEIKNLQIDELKQILNANKLQKIKKVLVSCCLGISTHTAMILLRKSEITDKNCNELTDQEINNLWESLKTFNEKMIRQEVYINFPEIDNSDFDFTYQPNIQEKISQRINEFYSGRENISRYKTLQQALRKKLRELNEKSQERLVIYQEKLKESEGAEYLQQIGSLLLANLHQFPEKKKMVKLENFYANNESITIELDENFTLAENAQKYYKKYQKSKNAKQVISDMIEKTKKELEYLEEIDLGIDNSDSLEDLLEIEKELQTEGFITLKNNEKKDKKKKNYNFLNFTSSDGLQILVGRNNTQNEQLTLKIAGEKDLWLHARLIPGSHVIVRTENGRREISEKTIIEAAKIAAKYSKAKFSSKVCVVYTMVKNIKKPPVSRPGLVTYSKEKAIYVNPD